MNCKIIICKECKKSKLYYAKGLCQSCYNKYYRKQLIKCKNCGKLKPNVAFNLCKSCYDYKNGISKPMNLNKSCTAYLGIHITEKLLSKVFKNVQQMPYGHKSFDFKCNKGMKIDAKSGILLFDKNFPNHKGQWHFNIKRNKIADYFCCVAFDNRESLTPQHIWLIPANKINHLQKLNISKNKTKKWSEYEMNLNKTLECCNEMKG